MNGKEFEKKKKEETERRFSRGERIGANSPAPRERPPLEHTAGDGQRLRRARPPRPMPCNLYRRRHCLTAPRRRRATGSTRHQSIHVAGGRFFVARIFVHFLGAGNETTRFYTFSQTGWPCGSGAGMPTDTPKKSRHRGRAVVSTTLRFFLPVHEVTGPTSPHSE